MTLAHAWEKFSALTTWHLTEISGRLADIYDITMGRDGAIFLHLSRVWFKVKQPGNGILYETEQLPGDP